MIKQYKIGDIVEIKKSKTIGSIFKIIDENNFEIEFNNSEKKMVFPSTTFKHFKSFNKYLNNFNQIFLKNVCKI